MRIRSLLIFTICAGMLGLLGCGQAKDGPVSSPVTSQIRAEKPVRPAVLPRLSSVTKYSQRVLGVVALSVAAEISPLEALQEAGHQVEVRMYDEMPMVMAVNGVKGMWVFAVDDFLPNNAWITGVGKVKITTAAEAEKALSRFRAGTLVLAEIDNGQASTGPLITAATKFPLPAGQAKFRIYWLNVGDRTVIP